MLDLGTVKPGSTLRIPFSSFDKDDGSSITMTNYAAADILVYKDGGTTERASTAGFTATTDFDSKTGKHLAVIDLADNTTAGFFAAGSEYLVAIDAVTVDAVTTGGWIARFRIGYPGAVLDTTIATLSSQTSFTLTDGPAEDDALNGMWGVVHDVASRLQAASVIVSDYVGSTKTVTLAAAPTFTIAASDNVSLIGPVPLQPVVMGRAVAVDSSNRVDVGAVAGTSQTARDLGAQLDAAVSTRAAAATALSTVQWTNTRAANLDNLDAAVSTRSTYAGADTSGTTTLLSRLSAGRATNLDNLDAAVSTRSTYAGADTSGTTTLLSRLSSARALLLDNLDAAVSSRSTYAGADTSGTTTLLSRLSSARATALDLLDVAISTRLATAGYTAPDNTSITAIKAKTDNLPVDPADASDIAASFASIASTLATIAAYIDTEVAAIKAKTDNLPASPAATGDIPTASAIRDSIFARAFSAAYGGLTFDELTKLMAAVLLGKASGLNTTTATYRNLADNADAVVATVDADGNRTAIVRTP